MSSYSDYPDPVRHLREALKSLDRFETEMQTHTDHLRILSSSHVATALEHINQIWLSVEGLRRVVLPRAVCPSCGSVDSLRAVYSTYLSQAIYYHGAWYEGEDNASAYELSEYCCGSCDDTFDFDMTNHPDITGVYTTSRGEQLP